MTTAGFESVFRRQDQYETGGIVESDERVDEGRNLYWPWCWPRTYIVKPLLKAGHSDRVRRFLDYWMKCQRDDGSWLHCYDIRDYAEYPGLPETDNVGYMLRHIWSYIESSNDTGWLETNWGKVVKAVEFLERKYNSELNLVWGVEECDIPGVGRYPVRYSLHINLICAGGIESAGRLAEVYGADEKGESWKDLAEEILTKGIKGNLWDAEKDVFSFGLTEDGFKLTAPAAWLTLMPYWLYDRFDYSLESYCNYYRKELYGKDPKIPGCYWSYNFSPVMDAGEQVEDEYSGSGVWIGGLPVVIHALMKAGRQEEAEEQLANIIKYTNPDNKLIPEHINTLHAGKLGRYSTYPEPYYYVDSGNLLHLSFFLTMIADYCQDILVEGAESAGKLH